MRAVAAWLLACHSAQSALLAAPGEVVIHRARHRHRTANRVSQRCILLMGTDGAELDDCSAASSEAASSETASSEVASSEAASTSVASDMTAKDGLVFVGCARWPKPFMAYPVQACKDVLLSPLSWRVHPYRGVCRHRRFHRILLPRRRAFKPPR